MTWPWAVVIIFSLPSLLLLIGVFVEAFKDRKYFMMFDVPELRRRLTDSFVEDRKDRDIHNVNEHIESIEHDTDVAMQVVEKWLLDNFNRGEQTDG